MIQKHSSELSVGLTDPFVAPVGSGFDDARRKAAATECTRLGKLEPRGVGRRERGVGIRETGVPSLFKAFAPSIDLLEHSEPSDE